jgi:hypothetical protein
MMLLLCRRSGFLKKLRGVDGKILSGTSEHEGTTSPEQCFGAKRCTTFMLPDLRAQSPVVCRGEESPPTQVQAREVDTGSPVTG